MVASKTADGNAPQVTGHVGAELRRFGVQGEGAPLKVVSRFEPAGDQPQAIEKLARGVREGLRYQTLMGVHGLGQDVHHGQDHRGREQAHAHPRAQQDARRPGCQPRLRELFPDNAVVYFVSYYDYYQPEAYVPQSDTFIEKDSSINEEVEKLRHQATASLLSRRDVICVASVSCIYGIGSPEDYAGLAANVSKDEPARAR